MLRLSALPLLMPLLAAIACDPASNPPAEGEGEGEGEGEAAEGEGEGEGEPAEGEGEGESVDALFVDGFEAGLSSWSTVSPNCSGSGTVSVVDGGRTGGKHLEVVGGGGYCDHVFVETPLPASLSSSTVHVRFFVRVTSSLSQGHVTFLTFPGAIADKDLRMGGQSGIYMWNRESDDATLPELSPTGIALSTTPTPNEWSCVEVEIEGAGGVLRTFVDDELVDGLVIDDVATADVDNQWHRGPREMTLTSLRLGWESYAGDARTIAFDDIVVDDEQIGCD